MSKICKYTTQGYYCQNIETFSGLSKADKLKKEIAELEKQIKTSKNPSETSLSLDEESKNTNSPSISTDSETNDSPSISTDSEANDSPSLDIESKSGLDSSVNKLEKSYDVTVDEIMKELINLK